MNVMVEIVTFAGTMINNEQRTFQFLKNRNGKKIVAFRQRLVSTEYTNDSTTSFPFYFFIIPDVTFWESFDDL